MPDGRKRGDMMVEHGGRLYGTSETVEVGRSGRLYGASVEQAIALAAHAYAALAARHIPGLWELEFPTRLFGRVENPPLTEEGRENVRLFIKAWRSLPSITTICYRGDYSGWATKTIACPL